MDKKSLLGYAVKMSSENKNMPAKTSMWKKIGLIALFIFALIGLVAVGAFIAIKLHLTNVKGTVDTDSRYLTVAENPEWAEGDEWQTLEKAAAGDKIAIDRASQATGVPSRLIVAQLVVEQLRLYNSDREIFKQVFQPLQILGVQSQFSWGVMGLKQDTAIQIENNLKNPGSPYYLGASYSHLLDFSASSTADTATSSAIDQSSGATTTDAVGAERFARLTDDHNHYYSYLYSALFIKEIETQWKKAGYDISSRPEIISTLFNIGFMHSNPNADPKVGGAEITVNGHTYSFGELAYAFYTSDKLLTEFPR